MAIVWQLVICMGLTGQCSTTAALSRFPSFESCEAFRVRAEGVSEKVFGHVANSTQPSECRPVHGEVI